MTDESDRNREHVLGEIREKATTVKTHTGLLDEHIRSARRLGASWTQIGEALGVTRQSAWERYHEKVGGPL